MQASAISQPTTRTPGRSPCSRNQSFFRTASSTGSEKHAKELRSSIEALAQQKGWPAEPFNGLNSTLQKKIRAHYQSSNTEFCRYFWADISWNELFWNDDQAAKPFSTTEWSVAIDTELIACREQVIADTLPNETVAELPK